MRWQPTAPGRIGGDWNASQRLDLTDPYLVWLDLSDFAGAGLPPGSEPLLPVIEELRGTFRTRLCNRDELRRLADPHLRAQDQVLRFEVAPGIVSEDGAAAAPAAGPPLPRRPRRAAGGARPVVGFIDYGCAFAHRQFRSGGPGLGTRVKAIWDQSGQERLQPGELQWRVPPAFGYGAETHRDAVWAKGALTLNAHLRRFAHNGWLDEAQCYRRSGYAPIIDRRATHGTHVMDLATGWPSPLRHVVHSGPAPAPHDADIVFVQLPRIIGGRQVGGLLRAHVYDAVCYILDRAASDQPVVINLSYGANAGPHDGSTVLERALDSELRRAGSKRSKPAFLVIASGNEREHRLHACADIGAGKTASFAWNNLPDDPSDSFVELWFPAASGPFRLRVTAPDAAPGDWIEAGRAGCWQRQGVVAALVVPTAACQSSIGNMALLAVARTRPQRGRAIAPYGTWRIEVHNASDRPARVDAWSERDIPAFGGEGMPRQACFSATESSFIDTDHTLNSIGHGRETIVVGGRAAGGGVAAYSGTGPGRGGDVARRLRHPVEGGAATRRGPDVLAPSDERPVVAGLMAAAVIGSDKLRLAGTSAAAAVFTRRIIESGFALPAGVAAPATKGGHPASPATLPRPAPAAIHPDSDLLD